MIGALRSEGPNTSTYGIAQYELPVTRDGRGRMRASISSNQFAVADLGGNLKNIVGDTTNFGVTGTYQFVRSRTFNLSAEAGYTQKDVLFDVPSLPSLSRDQQIEVGNVSVNYNQLWDDSQLLFSGRFGIDQGHIMNGAERNQSTDFTKTLFSANVLKRFSIDNWVTKKESFFNFVVRINGQYAETFLPSVEQFSLGGPNAVRAFSVSDVSVDSGAYAGFELFFDSPIDFARRLNSPIDPLRPFVFFDYGYGVAKTAGGAINRDAVLKAFGLGLRINWAGRGTANLVFARPRAAHYDDNFSSAQGESRVFFDIQYRIR
jgi:hemolysin activation/secretion protein